MPRLPQNLHHLTQPWQCDSQKHATRHVCSAAPATRNDGGLQSAAPATKNAENNTKVYKSKAPATQNDFRHVMKHVGMSQSAMPATRNEAGTSKSDHCCRTRHRHGHTALYPGGSGRLRTVPNGSERFRTVARCRAHASTPKPPVKREPLLRIREKGPVISGDAFSWQLWAWHSLSLQQSLNFVSSAARPLGTKIGKTDLWFQDVESNWNGSQGNKFNLCSSWFILCSSCFDSFLFFSLFFLVELNGQSRFHRKRTHRQHERSTRCPNTTQVAKLLWHTVRLTKDLWFLRTRVRHAESCWVMLLGKHQAAREKTQCMSRSFKIANAICQIVVGLWEFFAKLARAPILLVTRASQVLIASQNHDGWHRFRKVPLKYASWPSQELATSYTVISNELSINIHI